MRATHLVRCTWCLNDYCTRFSSPLWRYEIMWGPVYKRILLFLLSHRRRWSEKKIYRELCATGGGNIALPAEQLHNSSAHCITGFCNSHIILRPKSQPPVATCQKCIHMPSLEFLTFAEHGHISSKIYVRST